MPTWLAVIVYFLPIALVLGIHFRLKNKQYREEQRIKKWIEKKPWSN